MSDQSTEQGTSEAPETSETPETTPDQTKDDHGDDFDSLPDATKAEIRQLRRENQRLRKSAKESQPVTTPDGSTAVLEALAKALGMDLGKQGTTKAPTRDTGSDNAAELRLAKVELAVYRVAGAAGADPDALLDSRSFLREVEDLDPSDADFEKSIRDAMKTAMAQNANLRRKSSGKSGGDLSGGKGSTQREFSSPQERLAAAYAANSGT